MGLFNRFFGGKPEVSLDSVRFDISEYRPDSEDAGRRVWRTSGGDGLGLFFFAKPPDLPSNARTLDELKQSYHKLIGNDAVKIVEFAVRPIAGVNCIQMILKVPKQPHGIDYVGSITIPFAQFSFVIKIQASEHGITGMRETALMIRGQKEGWVKLTPDGKLEGDWNPDDQRHDALFPDHPVSRVRRELANVAGSLEIQDAARNAPRFVLPTGGG